jgi:hypothetical protein
LEEIDSSNVIQVIDSIKRNDNKVIAKRARALSNYWKENPNMLPQSLSNSTSDNKNNSEEKIATTTSSSNLSVSTIKVPSFSKPLPPVVVTKKNFLSQLNELPFDVGSNTVRCRSVRLLYGVLWSMEAALLMEKTALEQFSQSKDRFKVFRFIFFKANFCVMLDI